jgi:VanZ family protein
VKIGNRWYRYGSLVVAAGVLVASSWPSLSVQPFGWTISDKLQHFGVYAVLAYLAYRGWVPPKNNPRSGLARWLILLFLAVFAAADEYHQRWIPGRFVEWGDFLADTVGVMVGFFFGAWCNYRQHRTAPGKQSSPPPGPPGFRPS